LASPFFVQTPPASALTPMDPATRQVVVGQNDAGSSFTPVVSSTAPSFLFDVNQLKAQPASYPLR